LWKSFVEYTSNSGNLPEVNSGITANSPFSQTMAPNERDSIIFTFVIPRGDLVQFMEMVQPKLDKITEKTGKDAVIDISTDEVEIINKIERDQADFGSLSTMGYANFMNTKNIRAVLERYSDPPKRSSFVVRKDDSINSIGDLKDKRVAFKSKYSLPGYLAPISEIEDSGFDPANFFKQEVFSENYSNSLLGLLNNEFDCIFVASNYLMEIDPAHRENLKIIHESEPLPGGVFITRKDRQMSFEQIVTGNFMKLADNIPTDEMFAGMFKVRYPDEEHYRRIARKYNRGK
jgi:phosphonate transport system substrate-binding protein